jgi:primosomal protein N' (replication factor Y)
VAAQRAQAPPITSEADSALPYADVVVDVPTNVYDDAFTYAVPLGVALQPGHLVRVPFGPRHAHGVVLRLTAKLRVDYVKPIHSLVHPEPVIDATRLELAQWVSRYYRTPLFEALAPMLPPGFRTPGQATVRLLHNTTPSTGMPASVQSLVTYLHRFPNGVRVPVLTRRLGPWVPNVVQSLIRSGIAETGWAEAKPQSQGKLLQHVCLADSAAQTRRWADEHAGQSPRQSALARHLADAPEPYLASEARRTYGSSALVALVTKGLARLEMHPTTFGAAPGTRGETPLLPTEAQSQALAALTRALDDPATQPRVFLLQGVTGSGKTEVYLQALAHCLTAGKRGIVLVPELSLTPQTVAQFKARFPGQVGELHSGLAPAQQAAQWWQSHNGQHRVVVGSRSAVFAPQQDLGLIVLDEEHEWTYKQQDSSPRYHAREVAIRLSELTGAVVLLGSATPDVATSFHARQGHYGLLTLPQRIEASGAPVPLAQVDVVDMRQELRAGNRGIFSYALQDALAECVGSGHQAILFLNRRGSAGIVQCRSCGFVVRCWQCASPFTYHGGSEVGTAMLICHHCNRRRRVPTTCPACRSGSIHYMGLGTQRVVEEVQRLLPNARVLRWDRDTAKTAKAHQDLLNRYASGDADVLVGTQMIAKGLHVPSVTLVGVVLADIGLHVPDYRAGERAFQVLCQVAGRAGRGADPGRVIVQSYVPDHYAIEAARRQDYDAFYQREMGFRTAQRYPPQGRLIRLVFGHTDQATSQREVQRMAATLKHLAKEWGISRLDVIGPAPAYPQRLRGVWRWNLLLRGADPRMLLDKASLPPRWVVDVDPITTA